MFSAANLSGLSPLHHCCSVHGSLVTLLRSRSVPTGRLLIPPPPQSSTACRGEGGPGGSGGLTPPIEVKFENLDPIGPSPVLEWVAFCPCVCDYPGVKRLHLNFHETFVDRLRQYALDHRMKVNAVLQAAFELLEDQDKVKQALLLRQQKLEAAGLAEDDMNYG